MKIADFSKIKTDIHSHLIYGIDDGAKTIEESIILIKELKELGYEKIITTPHISPNYPNKEELIIERYNIIKEELLKQNIDIAIDVAAEYYLDFELIKKIENKEKLLTFGNNFLLFELSFLNQPVMLEDAIFIMQSNGYNPVMAHPERYSYFSKNIKNYIELKNKAIFLQCNINSLNGLYSQQAQKMMEKLLDNDLVDFIGTDTHNIKYIEILKRGATNKTLIKLLENKKFLNVNL